MIERMVGFNPDLARRMSRSLFSIYLDWGRSTYEPPHNVVIRPSMALIGKSVQRTTPLFEFDTVLDASISTPDIETSKRLVRAHLRDYMESVQAIMNGKQGIVASELTDIADPVLTGIVEDVTAEVAMASDSVYVLYVPIYVAAPMSEHSPLYKRWHAYLDYRGITEDDWVDGFAL